MVQRSVCRFSVVDAEFEKYKLKSNYSNLHAALWYGLLLDKLILSRKASNA